eukprot:scaffold12097_cov28-Cyclotella_meneghiniana.AAC.1
MSPLLVVKSSSVDLRLQEVYVCVMIWQQVGRSEGPKGTNLWAIRPVVSQSGGLQAFMWTL